jgi:hypothetical protein
MLLKTETETDTNRDIDIDIDRGIYKHREIYTFVEVFESLG